VPGLRQHWPAGGGAACTGGAAAPAAGPSLSGLLDSIGIDAPGALAPIGRLAWGAAPPAASWMLASCGG
jgi:hypothetical protein